LAQSRRQVRHFDVQIQVGCQQFPL
jgi:hypothetical protein